MKIKESKIKEQKRRKIKIKSILSDLDIKSLRADLRAEPYIG